MSTAKTKSVAKKAKAVAESAVEAVADTASAAVEAAGDAVSAIAETISEPVTPAGGQKSNKKALIVGAAAIGIALFWLFNKKKPAPVLREASSGRQDDEAQATWRAYTGARG